MAEIMTSQTLGTLTATVGAVAFLSLGVAMRSTASGSTTATVGTVTLSRTGMVSKSLGKIIATAPTVQMRTPAKSSTTGSIQLQRTPQVQIAVYGYPVYGVITGTNRRTIMRRSASAGLTVFDAAKEIYNLWSIEITDPRKINFARGRVVNYINQTVQLIHSRAADIDFFNKKEISAIVVGGTNSVALPSSVQLIHGFCRLEGGKPLALLASRSQVEQYTAMVYGDGPAPSTPRAYYIDATNTSSADNVAMTLYIAPTPVDNTTVKMDASLDPPRYDANDIIRATPLEIPNKFAETLFWPILRYCGVTDDNYTGKAEQRQDIATKYQTAMKLLGINQPKPRLVKPEEAPEQP